MKITSPSGKDIQDMFHGHFSDRALTVKTRLMYPNRGMEKKGILTIALRHILSNSLVQSALSSVTFRYYFGSFGDFDKLAIEFSQTVQFVGNPHKIFAHIFEVAAGGRQFDTEILKLHDIVVVFGVGLT